jgi:rhamnose transport system substrate-binding protein
MKKYINDGTVTDFALWNPSDLGYLAAYAAGALVSGEITGKQGDTFTAGKLGKYTVGADGEILLGKPYVFNKSNISQFKF